MIETVNDQLTEQFHIEINYARTKMARASCLGPGHLRALQ
jgi:hypothetical protein